MTADGVIPEHPVPDCGMYHVARAADGGEHDLFCERPAGHPGAHAATVTIDWESEASVPP